MHFLSFIKKNLIVILTIFFYITIILFAIIFFIHNSSLLSDPSAIKQLVFSYGKWGLIVFVLLQILQVVAFFIPGEVLQIAGGFVFGPIKGMLLCLLGAIIGGVVNFIVGRILGQKTINSLVNKKNSWIFKKLSILKTQQNYKQKILRSIFILYLLPGVPKDLLGYIFGTFPVGLIQFSIISTIARIPALAVTTFFGETLSKSNWRMAFLIIFVGLVFFFLALHYINKKKNKPDI